FMWMLQAVHLTFPQAQIDDRNEDEGALLQAGRAIQEDAEKWFERVAVWIAVYTGQNLHPTHPLHWWVDSEGLTLTAVTSNHGWQAVSPLLVSAIMDSDFERCCTRAVWAHAVSAASRAELPPLPWQLLISAERARLHDQFRIAILEIGMSVEAALRLALQSR